MGNWTPDLELRRSGDAGGHSRHTGQGVSAVTTPQTQSSYDDFKSRPWAPIFFGAQDEPWGLG